ncbi:acyl-CoA synthetase [[Mycobacterium] zoologicum]|uniref:acyl-CoA synthetase n=1 Tax=[Mycobacterium] zoologicum TaxID=2872311 RepID=UPI002C47DADE|nr:acyl-CoA synthetase [Mycolicibacter sp. MYC101]MEB3065654.1 acyl-CoA synthetase [Mycolicibacter sp. MYC101]
MSAADAPSPHDKPREKSDEDDHDLLTFGEAGERLRLEIAAAAGHLDRMERTGTPADIADARSRLATLRAAVQRNAAQPINDANFEKFFGYPGKAKRNLPGCTGN